MHAVPHHEHGLIVSSSSAISAQTLITSWVLQIRAPSEFQGTIIGDVNRRKGLIQNSEGEAEDVVVEAQVPLADMFGYSTGLRSMTQVSRLSWCTCRILVLQDEPFWDDLTLSFATSTWKAVHVTWAYTSSISACLLKSDEL